MGTEDSYRVILGAPDDVLKAIGEVVLAAGYLEMVARDILLNVGINPGKKLAGGVLRQLRSTALQGLPPVSTADPQDLIAWVESAQTLLDERNAVVHSAVHTRVHLHDRDQLAALHFRSGLAKDIGAEAIRQVAVRIARHFKRGLDLDMAVRLQDTAGGSSANFKLDPSGQISLASMDEGLAAWWASKSTGPH